MGRPDIYKLDTLKVGEIKSFTFKDNLDLLKKRRCLVQNAKYHDLKIQSFWDKQNSAMIVTRIK